MDPADQPGSLRRLTVLVSEEGFPDELDVDDVSDTCRAVIAEYEHCAAERDALRAERDALRAERDAIRGALDGTVVPPREESLARRVYETAQMASDFAADLRTLHAKVTP